MKRLIVVFITLSCILVLVACSIDKPDSNERKQDVVDTKKDEEIIIERSAEVMNYDLSELICLSDYVVKAKCIGYEETNEYTKTFFEVDDIISGDSLDKFTVYQYPTMRYIDGRDFDYESGINKLVEGDNYILVLEEDASVFYDEPHYLLLGDFYAKLNNNDEIVELNLYGNLDEERLFSNVSEAKELIPKLQTSINDVNKNDKVPFTASSETEEIINIADYVLEIEIIDISRDSSDRTAYNALVTGCYKGKTEGEIITVLPKSSVQIGKRYVVALNRVSDTSFIYVISSPYGIFNSTEIEEISAFCEE